MGIGYVPPELWGHPKLNPVDIGVYAALESYCDIDRRHCWPAQETLERMTGLKRRGLRGALYRLAEAGFVRIERKTVGGLKRGNVYHLRPARNGPSETVTPDRHSGTKRPVDGHETAHHSGTKRPMYSGTKRPIEGGHGEGDQLKADTPSPSAPAPGGGDLFGDQPVKATNPILDLFTSLCPDILPAKRPTGKKAAAASERAWRAEPDAGVWIERFKRAQASDFLTYRRPNDRGWKCTFLSLMKKIEELEEGMYDNRGGSSPQSSGRGKPAESMTREQAEREGW